MRGTGRVPRTRLRRHGEEDVGLRSAGFGAGGNRYPGRSRRQAEARTRCQKAECASPQNKRSECNEREGARAIGVWAVGIRGVGEAEERKREAGLRPTGDGRDGERVLANPWAGKGSSREPSVGKRSPDACQQPETGLQRGYTDCSHEAAPPIGTPCRHSLPVQSLARPSLLAFARRRSA